MLCSFMRDEGTLKCLNTAKEQMDTFKMNNTRLMSIIGTSLKLF